MKVKDIMTCEAQVCDLNASLAEAAKTMWEADCGVLPVLKDGKEIVGLITDRDICMAVAMRDCNPAAISAEQVISGAVYSVTPEDDVHEALKIMVHEIWSFNLRSARLTICLTLASVRFILLAISS